MKSVIYLNKKEVLYVIKSEGRIFYKPDKKYSRGDYKNKVIVKWGLLKKTIKEYVSEDLYYYRDFTFNNGLSTLSNLIKYIERNNGGYVYFDKEDQIFYYKPEINIYFKGDNKNYLGITFDNKQGMKDFIKKYDLDNYIKEDIIK